jgi:hypothetical protein
MTATTEFRADLIESLHLCTRARAVARLSELRSDRDWTRRYFAGDHDTQAEYDLLVWQANNGDAPMVCPMPVERSAVDMRRDAENRFDGPIPAEFLDAIKAQERAERTAR